NKDEWIFSRAFNFRDAIFSLGDSIASRIANQFTEATYDLFRSALMELGLVLLVVTLVVNSLARLLIWQMTRHRGPSLIKRLILRRKIEAVATNSEPPREATPVQSLPDNKRLAAWIDRGMTGLMMVCVAATVGPLFFILGYLIFMGVGSLDWAFFT